MRASERFQDLNYLVVDDLAIPGRPGHWLFHRSAVGDVHALIQSQPAGDWQEFWIFESTTADEGENWRNAPVEQAIRWAHAEILDRVEELESEMSQHPLYRR